MRDLPNAVMLFAAGRGTRMAPLTDSMPKPLVRVKNRPLLQHALDIAQPAKTIVANTHYMSEMIDAYLEDTNVITNFEPTLLETGGGLRAALPLLGDGPVMTLNTDAVWSGVNVLDQLKSEWNPKEMDALLSLVPLENAVGHQGSGDFLRDAEGRLTRGPGLVYTGAQIINPERLFEIEDDIFSLNVPWDMFAKEGRLFGLPYTGKWCDVGRPENIAMAEAMNDVCAK